MYLVKLKKILTFMNKTKQKDNQCLDKFAKNPKTKVKMSQAIL